MNGRLKTIQTDNATVVTRDTLEVFSREHGRKIIPCLLKLHTTVGMMEQTIQTLISFDSTDERNKQVLAKTLQLVSKTMRKSIQKMLGKLPFELHFRPKQCLKINNRFVEKKLARD